MMVMIIIPHPRHPAYQLSCTALVSDLAMDIKGKIEDDAPGMIHADFANMFIGGGVLGHGSVQEEILFAISPGTGLHFFKFLRKQW